MFSKTSWLRSHDFRISRAPRDPAPPDEFAPCQILPVGTGPWNTCFAKALVFGFSARICIQKYLRFEFALHNIKTRLSLFSMTSSLRSHCFCIFRADSLSLASRSISFFRCASKNQVLLHDNSSSLKHTTVGYHSPRIMSSEYHREASRRARDDK